MIYAMSIRLNSIFPRECRRCKAVKGEDGFTTYPYNGQRYHRSFCVECMREYDKKRVRNYTTYADLLETEKQSRRDSSNRSRARAREKNLCVCCKVVPVDGRKICASCRTKRNEQNKIEVRVLRKAVLDAYGHVCVCCPQHANHPDEFLSIDHVGGWGKDHRIASGSRISGASLYRWIIKNDFPDSIRILCYNCNCSLGHHGYCPHELERAVVSEEPQLISVQENKSHEQ